MLKTKKKNRTFYQKGHYLYLTYDISHRPVFIATFWPVGGVPGLFFSSF